MAFKYHTSCTKCGSSDALAVYEGDDSRLTGHCFSCETYFPNVGDSLDYIEEVSEFNTEEVLDISNLRHLALTDRGLTKEMSEYYGVKAIVNQDNGEIEQHYYPIYKGGERTGYKIRGVAEKSFTTTGDCKGKVELFGQHIYSGGGKLLIITEGECDAMAARQMLVGLNRNYRVVSLSYGANTRSIRDNLEFVESFESVAFAYDQDDAGKKVAKESAELLTPGKGKIMNFSEKDPNDLLRKGGAKEFLRSLNNAQEHRPDGIVAVSDIMDDALKPIEFGLPWPWPTLTEKTFGRRRRELYGFGAGSGAGKTEAFKEIINHVLNVDKLVVGLIFLEESPAMTLKHLAGKMRNKRYHVPDGDWSVEELEEDIKLLDGNVFLYDHWGQKEWETIKSKIRYMVVSLGIKDIFLDHLTALVAHETDQNHTLGAIMEEMASMTQELDFTLYFISHLATPMGTSHEEGGRVTASQFRGSRSIMFWSHFMFGFERNQQAETEDERNSVTLRVLKDRYTGQSTGLTIPLFYNHETGRFLEADESLREF